MAAPSPTPDPEAESQDIAGQIQTEHVILRNVEQALCVALEWKTSSGRNTRKLSTLRFVAHSFHRHWSRMRVLAEHGGYMSWVVETKPHLSGAVQGLKKQCDELGATLERIMSRLDHVSPDDTVAFCGVCSELERLLKEHKSHDEQETQLYQQAVAQDEGGPG